MRTSTPTNFYAAPQASFDNGSRLVSLRVTRETKYKFEPFITIVKFATATKWHFGIRWYYIEQALMTQDFSGVPFTGTAYLPMLGPSWSNNNEVTNYQTTVPNLMPYEAFTNLIHSAEWFWAQPNYSVSRYTPDWSHAADGSKYMGTISTNGLTPRMYLDERFPGTSLQARVMSLIKDCITNERVVFEQCSTDTGSPDFYLYWPMSISISTIRQCQHIDPTVNDPIGRTGSTYVQYPRGCDFGFFRSVLQGVINDWSDNWTKAQDGALAPSGARTTTDSGSTDVFILYLNIQNFIWTSDSRNEWYGYASQWLLDGTQFSTVHTAAPPSNLI